MTKEESSQFERLPPELLHKIILLAPDDKKCLFNLIQSCEYFRGVSTTDPYFQAKWLYKTYGDKTFDKLVDAKYFRYEVWACLSVNADYMLKFFQRCKWQNYNMMEKLVKKLESLAYEKSSIIPENLKALLKDLVFDIEDYWSDGEDLGQVLTRFEFRQ